MYSNVAWKQWHTSYREQFVWLSASQPQHSITFPNVINDAVKRYVKLMAHGLQSTLFPTHSYSIIISIVWEVLQMVTIRAWQDEHNFVDLKLCKGSYYYEYGLKWNFIKLWTSVSHTERLLDIVDIRYVTF